MCEEQLKIFQKVLLTSSLFALSSASFAETTNSFIKNKNKESNSISIFEKPILIAENPISYVGFDTLKITVTGTRTERAIKDVPSSISNFDYDEINSIAPLSWRDLFKYDAAISSQDFTRSDGERTYATGDKGNINIRGLDGNRILTLIDGIPIPRFSYGRDGTYAASRLNYIDFSNIGNVDVLKGAGSSLYGSDAMGGVVSIRSLMPDDILEEDQNSSFEISSPYNSQNNSYQPSLKYAFRENDLAGVFSISTGSFSELNRNTDNKYINDIDGDINSYYIKLIKNIGNTDYNLVYENIDKETNQTASSYYNTKNSLTSQKDKRESTRSRISLGFKYKSSEDKFIDKFSGQIYSNIMENKSDYGTVSSSGAANTLNDLDQEMLGGNLQFTNNFSTKGNDQKLTYGFEINHNDASRVRTAIGGREPGTYKSNPDSDVLKLGFYIQDEIKFKKWDVIAGIRYDANNINAFADDAWYDSGSSYLLSKEDSVGKPISKDYSNWSPSLAAIYKFNKNLNLYGKYSRGFRAPSWEDLNSSRISLSSSFSYTTIGNPNLKEETSNNYELGLKGRTKKADFGISTFLNNYNNFLDPTNTTGNVKFYTVKEGSGIGEVDQGLFVKNQKMAIEYQTRNIFDVQIWGIETNYKYHFSERNKGLSFSASTSFVKGENQTDNQNLDTVNPFQIVTNFDYIFPSNKLSASITNTYVGVPSTSKDYRNPVVNGKDLSDNVYIPDAFITTDFVLKFKPSERFVADLGVYNVFDTTYYLWSDMRANGFTGSDDVAYQRYAQPGTSVKAGFKWRF